MGYVVQDGGLFAHLTARGNTILLAISMVEAGWLEALFYVAVIGAFLIGVVSSGGLHIHHLVWGILLLLVVGYVWLIQEGTGQSRFPSWFSRATAILYGVGAALTLDEFALWLNLQDVYWAGKGRESVDAVVIFASFLSVGIWGFPFLAGVARELRRLRKHA